jgi:hypothetical protein
MFSVKDADAGSPWIHLKIYGASRTVNVDTGFRLRYLAGISLGKISPKKTRAKSTQHSLLRKSAAGGVP